MPELLCPAGSFDSLRAALHFGADAVYGGMKRFGLRAFAGNFDEEQLREAVQLCHAAGKKFYLTMNVLPFDDQLEDFAQTARIAHDIGVDAAIVRDLGCKRVILAREVSIERAKVIAEKVEGLEIETFVHGAACMAYSGRCLLSAALNGRSGNQGECAQPCRWQYAVMEQKRPGEYLPVSEDLNGTYIFSAKDLNLMPLLPELVKAGVASLKIEGRMKTEYYVSTVTAAYRRALDLLSRSEEAFRDALPSLMEELACASHRDSDTGFALDKPQQPGGAEGFHQSREYIARAVEESCAGEEARFLLKNRFHAGDELELLTSRGVTKFIAQPFLREKTGEMLETLGVAGEFIRMKVPCGVQPGDILRGQVRNHRL